MLPTDTAYKAVEFMPTFTGRAIYPHGAKMGLNKYSIIDIAHHLSNQCRYAGASAAFYSTAQHSCILHDHVKMKRGGSPLDCLQILMHDSAEAYIHDMGRPLKQYLPLYREWDHNLTMDIRKWMGWQDLPIPAWQDEVDTRIILDEQAAFMRNRAPDCPEWPDTHYGEPLGVLIEPWTPTMAEQQFLMRYCESAMHVYGDFQYMRSGWGVPTHSKYIPDFKTRSTDIERRGPQDPITVTDLIEVDIRGGVGRVVLRTPDGMMIRDPEAGSFPRPAWEFIHGKFELLKQGQDNGLG